MDYHLLPSHQILQAEIWEADRIRNCTLCTALSGEGNGNTLQYSCLEKPRDGGAWWAAVCGVAQSQTRLKRLSSSSRALSDVPGSLICSRMWGEPGSSQPAAWLNKYLGGAHFSFYHFGIFAPGLVIKLT